MDSKSLLDSIQKWLHLKSKVKVEGAMPKILPAELFTADQMERHAITLALSHTLSKKSAPTMLLQRLAISEATLIESCTILSKKDNTNEGFLPAREWLLDNFYLVEEQIYAIRRNLPKGYGRSLPQLAGGVSGYPRIYDIALQIIEHGDGRWDLENLSRFITAYQSVTALTLGELWATPITLGVALIENLSRVSQRIVADRADRNLADHWADQLLEVAVSDPKKLVLIIADMARAEPMMSNAFVSELARRLQGTGLSLPLSWMEQHLAEEGLTIDQVVQEENKQQAANQVTVSNCISGLRNLGEVDWRDFVENLSVVDQVLRKDPSSTYYKMDFTTRDCYRHAVERLSRKSKKSEKEVANEAILLAKKRADVSTADELNNPNIARYCHVGFYLIDAGLGELEQKIGAQYSFWQKICRGLKRSALVSYAGSILFLTFGLTTVLVFKASSSGIDTISLWILGLVIALCGSQLSVALVNLLMTVLVKPEALPKMDFTEGIPSWYRSLVVVPALLSSRSGVDALIEALEIRFLGNRDKHLHFALLTDFKDAAKEHMPEDEDLLSYAETEINALNKKYPREESDSFLLFHRPREWNESEKVWMGKERKRGKLAALNEWLRNGKKNDFSVIIGRTEELSNVKYVITLDSDTELPRESARQYVACMVHPLNRPRLDIKGERVIEGYGILQPRVAETLQNTPSRYVWLCGNEFGIDPYTRTVSDVYQDLFHEGSFIGKGIYDVDFCQQVLGGRFPNNRILSHDLLEGCYLRSGFLSDVPLYEKSPNNYLVDASRRMRWVRGDWQLLPWLLPFVSNENNAYIKNPLSLLSKLKLLDNLRRSLVPIGLVFLIGFSLTLLPTSFFWLSIVLCIVILPAVTNALLELLRKPHDMLASQHLITILPSVRRRIGQFIIYLACLPHEAWYSLMAILRTLWRIFISKRHLLEWIPSDQINQNFSNAPRTWLANMWMGPFLAILSAATLMENNRFDSLLLASPLLLLWFCSPLILWWLSQPIQRIEPKLNPVQIRFLHRMARKTWGFFETFITAEDHWLPPDNFQEIPVATLARRTSPTNMGLSLLANLTAYDFGYITLTQLLERSQNALQTMMALERYRGHLYNWYDTETLKPLFPRYISTVDSGNLAGHLLTLRQGLLALLDEPLLNKRYLAGLEDTWSVLVATFSNIPHELKHFRQLLNEAPNAFMHWESAIVCCTELNVVAEQVMALSSATGATSKISSEWSEKLLQQCRALQDEIGVFASVPEITVNTTLRDIVTKSFEISQEALMRASLIETLINQALSLSQMDIHFLYDDTNHLMTIGYNVDEQRRDPSNYDLLSSEARIASFVAIAEGQVLQESWFALGRLLVSSGGEPILISWSGSMFEYLMPLLVMPTYPGTLLDQTYHAAVKRQIAYGKQRGVPWGVSESGYNAVDAQYNYLYRAFGVPGLGLKRGLEEDLVIAPYASALALMVKPQLACQNLQRLATEDALGKFGFYEAIDYTQSRLPPETKKALIRSYMAHHQGMTLLSFSYLLHNKPMQRRFVADPRFQATLLLLQERIPRPMKSYLQIPKGPEITHPDRPLAWMRIFNSPNTHTPQVQLLSNGNYHVVLTPAGGGYSRWKGFALTRWREDSTCDHWGLFGFIRDVETGEFSSINYQPVKREYQTFKAVFSEGHTEFNCNDMSLDMHTEVVVSPEDDIELRRLRLYNRAKTRRTIEFTSYAEIVLAPQATDEAQSTFSNLFVETELLLEQQTLLAHRRSQDEKQNPPWLFHLLNVYSEKPYTLSFETDRARFIGRCRSLAAPEALLKPGALSNTVGAVLDPIISIRCQVVIEPNAVVLFDLFTGVADTRSHCVNLVEKYRDLRLANRTFELSWTHGQVLLHHLNISEADAQLFGKLASGLIYANNTRRASQRILASNRRGQSGLWGYSISGDLPIVLLYIEEAANIELVRQLIQAQAYWRHKGLITDLFIINEEHISYRQTLQEEIMRLVNAASTSEHAGCIAVRIAEQLPLEDSILLQSVARVILSDKRGSLKEQLKYKPSNTPFIPALKPSKSRGSLISSKLEALPKDLQFYNGFGGFTKAGDEYLIRLTPEMATPAPWVNVIANPHFGTVLSESGQAYTWTENAHEFRLTPWDNDPIQDPSGEAYYLRDEETGLFWSPTPLPCRGSEDYQIRHGFGYSTFEHIEDGIYSELSVTVALDAPLKFVVLKIRNDSLRLRHISATGYVAWVLGDLRAKNAPYVVTELAQNGAIFAQNHYNTEFGERTAFFDATSNLELSGRSVTGDRQEFLGRNGSYREPAALKRQKLSGRLGAGFDPCGAIQLNFDLERGETREIVFVLGAGKNKEEAITLVQRYQGIRSATAALALMRQYWARTLSVMQVSTPDASVNLLANGWLLYQMLSSRLWGRSGYYQSGGAFGFRDQLQDVMALTHITPELFRQHLLLCASHQFEEGDVQHWWHPPQNRGVRTRCSDDYLWLPFAICRYIEATGDKAVLDEAVPFIQGRPLKEEEESYYDLPVVSSEKVSLYQHAVRAIKNGLKFGVHGLPLIGSGDWNDGMNQVGIEGRGESVWLGFFLYNVLSRFAVLALHYGDNGFADFCKDESQKLKQNIENHAWDGHWYRRAYFDDGTPLGSASNSECQIDSIAQSWSVLSKASDPQRAKEAMDSLYQHLVSSKEGLVKLLDPPFDKSKPSPGYIMGYVPGIRENGGQYTHGAIWAAMAFAELGEKELAWQLLHILNPIHHGQTFEDINRYKIEPYVIAGDVYSVVPHTGRGGWSWYTGSAGWLYRLITETLLGMRLENGNQLHFAPLIPEAWKDFSLDYLYGKTVYKITASRLGDKKGLWLNEVLLPDNIITLQDDGQTHYVKYSEGSKNFKT